MFDMLKHLSNSVLCVMFLSVLILGFTMADAQNNIPYIETEIQDVTPYHIQYRLLHNDECHHVYLYKDRGNEVELMSKMLGLSYEDVVYHWGRKYDTIWSFFWTDLKPMKQYTIWAVPADSSDRLYGCIGTPFITAPIGGRGRSSIQVYSSFITDATSYVVCKPNAETCGYHNGIVSASWYEKLGLDSLCSIINRFPTIYQTDRWGRLLLNHGTRYCMIAFGQNADGVPGDTTVHWFTTPGDLQVNELDTIPVISYFSSDDNTLDIPIPIEFLPIEFLNQYIVRISKPDRSKTLQEAVLGDENVIIATLPAGDYFVDVVSKNDGKTIKEIRLYNRKKDIINESHAESDGFKWTRLRQDCLYAVGDSTGAALTPFIFTQLDYIGGFFKGRTHSGKRLYDVILTKQGDYLIGPDRGYDYINYNGFENTFWFSKNRKMGICDSGGKNIIAPIYDDIVSRELYYEVNQNGLKGCVDKSGRVIFQPQFDSFEKDKYGFKAMKGGVEYYIDSKGKVLGTSDQETEIIEE